MKQLLLASGNAGKLKEFQALLAPLQWDVIPQQALGIPEAPEPHMTFVENALAKARHAAQLGKLPALADDSGICVEALGGAPGVILSCSVSNSSAKNPLIFSITSLLVISRLDLLPFSCYE